MKVEVKRIFFFFNMFYFSTIQVKFLKNKIRFPPSRKPREGFFSFHCSMKKKSEKQRSKRMSKRGLFSSLEIRDILVQM